MTDPGGPQEPLEHVLRDSRGLDALAAGVPGDSGGLGDAALDLLAALRSSIDDDLVSLRDPRVGRDELLLDLVAGGVAVRGETDGAASLLAALRAEIDRLPAPLAPFAAPAALVETPAAVPPLAPVIRLSGHAVGRRRVLRAAAAAAALVGALSTSGVAAAAYSSHPGGSLYALRVSLYGRTDDDPEVPRDLIRHAQDEYVLAATGNPTDASRHVAAADAALASAGSALPHLPDVTLRSSFASQAAAVQSRLQALPVPPAALAGAAPASPPAASPSAHARPGDHPASPSSEPAVSPDRRRGVDGSPAVGPVLLPLADPSGSAPVTVEPPSPVGTPEPSASPGTGTGTGTTPTPETSGSPVAGPSAGPTGPVAPAGPSLSPSGAPSEEPTASPTSPGVGPTPTSPVTTSPSAQPSTQPTAPATPVASGSPVAPASPTATVARATGTTAATTRPRATPTPAPSTTKAPPKPRKTPRPRASPTLEPVGMVTPGVNVRPDPGP